MEHAIATDIIKTLIRDTAKHLDYYTRVFGENSLYDAQGNECAVIRIDINDMVFSRDVVYSFIAWNEETTVEYSTFDFEDAVAATAELLALRGEGVAF